jgi:Domain of unknown function (DUF4157)
MKSENRRERGGAQPERERPEDSGGGGFVMPAGCREYYGLDPAPGDELIHRIAQGGLNGSGGALPHLDRIRQSFGRHDVGHVQAHTGERASRAAQAMGAEAYASGNHVAFAGAPGLHTAAHEAAHVIQQRGGVQLAGGVGAPGDPYERHADEVADAVVEGRSAEALLDRHAAGGAGGAPAVQQVRVTLDGKETDTSRLSREQLRFILFHAASFPADVVADAERRLAPKKEAKQRGGWSLFGWRFGGGGNGEADEEHEEGGKDEREKRPERAEIEPAGDEGEPASRAGDDSPTPYFTPWQLKDLLGRAGGKSGDPDFIEALGRIAKVWERQVGSEHADINQHTWELLCELFRQFKAKIEKQPARKDKEGEKQTPKIVNTLGLDDPATRLFLEILTVLSGLTPPPDCERVRIADFIPNSLQAKLKGIGPGQTLYEITLPREWQDTNPDSETDFAPSGTYYLDSRNHLHDVHLLAQTVTHAGAGNPYHAQRESEGFWLPAWPPEDLARLLQFNVFREAVEKRLRECPAGRCRPSRATVDAIGLIGNMMRQAQRARTKFTEKTLSGHIDEAYAHLQELKGRLIGTEEEWVLDHRFRAYTTDTKLRLIFNGQLFTGGQMLTFEEVFDLAYKHNQCMDTMGSQIEGYAKMLRDLPDESGDDPLKALRSAWREHHGGERLRVQRDPMRESRREEPESKTESPSPETVDDEKPAVRFDVGESMGVNLLSLLSSLAQLIGRRDVDGVQALVERLVEAEVLPESVRGESLDPLSNRIVDYRDAEFVRIVSALGLRVQVHDRLDDQTVVAPPVGSGGGEILSLRFRGGLGGFGRFTPLWSGEKEAS